MTGWIKIHRDLAEHWISQDMEKLGRWIDLLMYASHKDNKVIVGGKLIEVKRGQMIASCDFLAKRWKCSKSTVSTFLELLESDKMVERYTERKTTILTICNYDSYQQAESGTPNDIPNDNRTMSERCPNELKNVEECKEYKLTNSAHVCEENIQTWVAEREQQFCNTFKGLGAAIPLATKTGKTASDILKLLDVYMAHRQLKNLGHIDYRAFVNLFTWHIEQNKITIPTQPEQEKPKKKVKTNEDFYKEMYG